MKSLNYLVIIVLLTVLACKKKEIDPIIDKSIIPATFKDRSVEEQGTIEVNKKEVTFLIWDSGQIDGDIVSLYVNGKAVISNYTLTGAKKSIPVTLENKGYNYILLFAHNEGSIPPNTCAVSIDDGTKETNLVLSANLKTNGAYNIVVK